MRWKKKIIIYSTCSTQFQKAIKSTSLIHEGVRALVNFSIALCVSACARVMCMVIMIRWFMESRKPPLFTNSYITRDGSNLRVHAILCKFNYIIPKNVDLHSSFRPNVYFFKIVWYVSCSLLFRASRARIMNLALQPIVYQILCFFSLGSPKICTHRNKCPAVDTMWVTQCIEGSKLLENEIYCKLLLFKKICQILHYSRKKTFILQRRINL